PVQEQKHSPLSRLAGLGESIILSRARVCVCACVCARRPTFYWGNHLLTERCHMLGSARPVWSRLQGATSLFFCPQGRFGPSWRWKHAEKISARSPLEHAVPWEMWERSRQAR